MNINQSILIFENGVDHNTAFRMPPRASLRPRGRPANPFVRGLPQSKIQWGFLLGIHFDPSARHQRFRRIPGQASIAFIFRNTEIDIATTDIGRFVLNEVINIRNHLRHINRRLWGEIRLQSPYFFHQMTEFCDHRFRQFLFRDSQFFRAFDNFVIHVRVIRNISYLVA